MPPNVNTWAQWLNGPALSGTELLRNEMAIPDEVLDQAWNPQAEDRSAAWELYTELRTRITTQPLTYLDGDERAALESVAKLFGITRELIRKYGPESRHFTTLTTFTLNRVIRKFTAKWYKRAIKGELDQEDIRHTFRFELQHLQSQLRQFTTMLGVLAEGSEYVSNSESWPDHGSQSAGPESVLPFNVLFDDDVCSDIQNEIRWCEHNAIRERRGLQPLPDPLTATQSKHSNALRNRPSKKDNVDGDRVPFPPLPNAPDREVNITGLAISGGGLRSATFALGAVQALAENSMLGQFDYLSTVSGGGYTGSFLSSYLNTSNADVGPDGCTELPFRQPPVGESAAMRHLRAHSKFLLTGGLFGRLIMLLQAVYGFAANFVIFLSWLMVAIVATDILFHAQLQAIPTGTELTLSDYLSGQPLLLIAWAIIGILLVVMPLVLRYCRAIVSRRYQQAVAIASAGMVVLTAIAFIPVLFRWHYQLRPLAEASWVSSEWTWLACVALLQRVATTLTWIKTSGRWLKILPIVLLAISGPLFFLIIYLLLGRFFLVDGKMLEIAGVSIGGTFSLIVVTAALMLYSHAVLDINQSSLHPFYRDRLSDAYLIKRDDQKEADKVKQADRQKLSEMRDENPQVPYHLINTTLNSPSGTHPSLRGRNSDFFLLSEQFCGCPSTGYFHTSAIEKLDRRLNLGTAMAISGAAASPILGTKANPARVLMTLLNIRLDYWLPLPSRRRIPLLSWKPGPWYLLRQMVRRVDEKSAYVNLSDGGHIENLGVYELLRRCCKYIVVIDGECDPQITCSSFINLQRLAYIDFGIRINIDLSRLKQTAEGTVPFHFALGTVNYPASEPDGPISQTRVGYLLYLKSSLTGNEAPPITRYRAEHEDFPHESTADLFYDEEQFEAYRSLGYHIASEVFRQELTGGDAPKEIQIWFANLVANLHDPLKL